MEIGLVVLVAVGASGVSFAIGVLVGVAAMVGLLRES